MSSGKLPPSSRQKQDALLAAIQKQTSQPVASSGPASPPAKPSPNVVPAPLAGAGKPVQFWLHEDDRRLIRELATWLSSQGIRTSDSLVVRAALRTAKTGAPLLEAYRQAAQADGRLKR
jgi:hypothetical protein